MNNKQLVRVNRKHKQFMKNVLDGDNVGIAAKRAGFISDKYGHYLMKQPVILTALQRVMEQKGLTDEYIAKKIKQGLNAYYVKKDGGKKYPDFHARDKFVDKVLKVRGDYAPEKHQIEEKRITLVITPDFLKGLVDSKTISKDDVLEFVKEANNEDSQETQGD